MEGWRERWGEGWGQGWEGGMGGVVSGAAAWTDRRMAHGVCRWPTRCLDRQTGWWTRRWLGDREDE